MQRMRQQLCSGACSRSAGCVDDGKADGEGQGEESEPSGAGNELQARKISHSLRPRGALLFPWHVAAVAARL